MGYKDRIVAGKWKGRTLELPADDGIRPTRNRVRQAVFNMLGSRLDWDGLRVVDLCCGSGALGLEAASRGAAEVVLVDVDVKAAQKNVREGDGVDVVRTDVRAYAPARPFDVVLADPPYGSGLAAKIVRRAGELGAPGSWWAIECGVEEAVDWSGFEDVVTRVFGTGKVMLGRLV